MSTTDIPEAAVEAAARGMFAEEQCDRRQKLDVESNWRGRLDDRDRDEYRRLTRAALEAGAPFMRPDFRESNLKAISDEIANPLKLRQEDTAHGNH